MEPLPWAVDWNPDFEDDHRIKRAVLRALKEDNVLETIERLAQQSIEETLQDGIETEHLVWLEADAKFAFFVRIWFEASEEKVFVILEENDLGDVGFLLLEDFDCASYDGEKVLTVEFREPDTLGVEP